MAAAAVDGGAGVGSEGCLSRFVRAYLDETGDSVRGLARRSRDPISGLSLKHGWLNELVNGEREVAPDLRRLRALAAGMGEPVQRLAAMAAAQWLGVAAPREFEEAGVWVPTGRALTSQEKERFLPVARVLLEQMLD